jgi:hypothetical protein
MSYQLQVEGNTNDNVSAKKFLKLKGVKAGKVAHKCKDGYTEQWITVAGYSNLLLQYHRDVDNIFAINVWGGPGDKVLKALAKQIEAAGGELYDEEEPKFHRIHSK